jgi:3'-5' exoribonuclease 1
MNFIIFDLEATCWEEKGNLQAETIEIGAVKVNSNKDITGHFNVFIRPVLHPVLSEFCKKLTSIRQSDIDMAISFPEAIGQFKSWIGTESPYLLCSWGFYDKKQLTADSVLHKLDINWLEPHISVKHQHALITKQKRAIGLEHAIRFEEMHFQGIAHRGIDDAKNIATIFLKHFGKWYLMSFS